MLKFQEIYTDYIVVKQHPIIRIFGRASDNSSVCVKVHGVEPYLYVRSRNESVKQFIDVITQMCVMQQVGNIVKRVEEVVKTAIYKYQKAEKYFKVVTYIPNQVQIMRTIFEKMGIETFESNVLFVIRYMVDYGITPLTWIMCRNYGKYNSVNDLVQIDYNDESSIANIRIMSFDIECLSEKGFPSPDRDECKVIVIANVLTTLVDGKNVVLRKDVFVLCKCHMNFDENVTVYSIENERALLVAWARYISTIADPDIITGYNIIKFDIPYLVKRAGYLGVPNSEFAIGRENSCVRLSKGADCEVCIPGRVVLDILNIIRREHRLSSYRLNNVSSYFLNEQKEDVHYSMIGVLFKKGDEAKKRIVSYCLKDAMLPILLIDKLQIVYNQIEMARVCGLPMHLILSRGQQIRVMTRLLRESTKRNYIIPTKTVNVNIEYTGAVVLNPKPGYYKDPIITLDFASLYPSIMIVHNLCYSTLTDDDNNNNTIVTPAGHRFVNRNVVEGILPAILSELLTTRDNIKRLIKKTDNIQQKVVLNGRQLAVKTLANSVYGFTGAAVGQLPCVQISSSVTAYGRLMIMNAKKFIETQYSFANIIYGDTDSLMISIGNKTVQESIEFGEHVANKITESVFTRPIKLIFEKTYCPYLLFAKKHYAGLVWTNSASFDRVDTKGIESVRRDRCPLLRNIITKCLNLILIKSDTSAVVTYLKWIIQRLVNGQIDTSLLLMSKTLSDKIYKTKQPHSVLAAKMAKRNTSEPPVPGDRIYFVYIVTHGNKDYEKSEDPIYALTNNLDIDYIYYLEKKIKPVLQRFLAFVLTEKQINNIFCYSKPLTTVISKGDIMKYVNIKHRCINCKLVIQTSEALCGDCIGNSAKIYLQLVNERNQIEEINHKMWSHCIHYCQCSLTNPVVCSNLDCPLFFKRYNTKNKLDKLNKQICRFDLL